MIDAHVHHWQLDRFSYPWLNDPTFDQIRSDYLPDDHRAGAAGMAVEGWVHVQAEVDHRLDPVAETVWVASLADQAGRGGVAGPVACVVYADLRAANLGDVLTRHRVYPLTRGVRQEAWFDARSTRADIPRENLLRDPAWRRGYRMLAEFGMSFDLLVWPRQLREAADIAAEVPDVPIVLEHLGLPDPAGDPGLRSWRAGVTTLAELPHACVKLSAFSWLGNPVDRPAVRAVVGELIELFGPSRCMAGSNFPVERLAGPFAEWYQLLLDCLDGVRDENRAEILNGTAARFYRIPERDLTVAPGPRSEFP